MRSGGNQIYGLRVITHNRLFAECEVLDNFPGRYGTRTRTYKLVLEDPRKQGLHRELQHW